MPRIGLRELKTRASEVLRDVEENHVRYVITKRGQPQAILIPYSPADEAGTEDPAVAWRELAGLLADASKKARTPESTGEIMKWLRRY